MKKLAIVAAVVLVAGGAAAYKLVLAPKPAEAHEEKVKGGLVALDPEFIVNLADGRYAKFSVAVLVPHAPAGEHGAAPELEQNAIVRAVITNELTGVTAATIVSKQGRHRILQGLVKALGVATDESVQKVYFTDIAIQ